MVGANENILTWKQHLTTVLMMRLPPLLPSPMSLTLALMIVMMAAAAVALLVAVVVEELQSPHDFVTVYNLISPV